MLMSKRGWDVKGTGMHPTNIFKENPDKESPKDIYYMCSHFKLKKEKGDKYNCDYETHNCNFTRGASAYKCLMYQEETDKIKKEERINYGKRKENEKRKNKNPDNRNGKYEQSINEPNILLPLIKREGLVKCKLVIADEKSGNKFVAVLLSIRLQVASGEKETMICYDLKKAFVSKNINVKYYFTDKFVVPQKDVFGNWINKQDIPKNFAGEAWCFYTKGECNLTVINKAIDVFTNIIYQGIEEKRYVVTSFYFRSYE